MSSSVQPIAHAILDSRVADPSGLAETVVSWIPERQAELTRMLLPDASGRRWLRGSLLPRLAPSDAASLARQLLAFQNDFASSHRDTTTSQVVNALMPADLTQSASFFAGSNAAGSFWRRIVAERPEMVPDLARTVLDSADAAARETTISILLLDPYSDVQLTGSARVQILIQALDDSEASVRGIAADVLADEDPDRLAQALDRLSSDPSERVRMAGWDAAFASDFERARDAAFELALDESAPLEPRRTAVAALSAVLSTNEMVPLLEVLVSHPNRVLAEDAVNLLWTYHRNPVVATAASESPHETVREVAQRLLHPETGSPAAGGSRPGAPEAPRDIYQEMLKGYERREE